MDCQICCEKFTKSARKEVKCPCSDCDASYCLACFKRYILESEDIMPKCMSCSKELSYSFVRSLVPACWANGVYMKRRAEHLMSREKSLLPDSQEDVRKELDKRRCDKESNKIDLEITKLTHQIRNLQNQQNDLWATHFREFNVVKKNRNVIVTRRRCPVEDCEGFINSNWKCGICETSCCSECGEVKEEEHECNEDAKATFKLIKNDTRPCPQCGIPIHKWQGCNQMYCTQCSCMFNYRTGELENGFFHNPHYFEAIDNGTIHRRNVNGRQQMGCGMPDAYTFTTRLKNMKRFCTIEERDSLVKINNLYRLVSHLTDLTLRDMWLENAYDDDCRTWRRDYLMKELTEENWLSKLKVVEKQREKNTEIRQLITLFRDISLDCITNINVVMNKVKIAFPHHIPTQPRITINGELIDPVKFIMTQLDEVNRMQGFVNEKAAYMEKKFKLKMPRIDSTYILHRCWRIY